MSEAGRAGGASGRGLGKLILLGEHSVVYGHRALAAAVSLGTTAQLTPRSGPTALVGGPSDPRLDRALAAALPAEGWSLTLESDLPLGRGMGSSAALTIALLRARAAAEGRAPDFETLHREGFALERIFHGNPSGLDHAVAALGGAVVYRKGERPAPIPMRPRTVVVLDTGVAGDTSALVAGVAARRPAVDPLLERLGTLVEEALPELDDDRALGARMYEAHALLRQIGVSTPALDDLVELARGAGALGAKLSGAGGGGVVVALPDGPPAVLLDAARRYTVRAFVCRLPEGGLS